MSAAAAEFSRFPPVSQPARPPASQNESSSPVLRMKKPRTENSQGKASRGFSPSCPSKRCEKRQPGDPGQKRAETKRLLRGASSSHLLDVLVCCFLARAWKCSRSEGSVSRFRECFQTKTDSEPFRPLSTQQFTGRCCNPGRISPVGFSVCSVVVYAIGDSKLVQMRIRENRNRASKPVWKEKRPRDMRGYTQPFPHEEKINS